MKQALMQAKKAARADEVPVGALVVNKEGAILARGYNKVEKTNTQLAHAEMRALATAGRKQGDWRLDDCWLYVTLEPCAMCMGLAVLSRCAGIVYAAPSPLFGYRLVDNEQASSLYKKDTIRVVSGVSEQESTDMLKAFFRLKRESQRGR